MHGPLPLLLHAFGAGDPLAQLNQSFQVAYVRGYLSDLGAVSVLEEQQYFDRDYLAEFTAFYGVSSAGYSNVCRRLHFFSAPALQRNELEIATSSSEAAAALQSRYLGFIVVRPIPQAPLGRTVLKWYPDKTPSTPRVVNPSREYRCNVAGLKLTVNGLAWQQQDTGVGACATVGLWTMMHSSAFDDTHAIPTTAEITRSAHEKASLGSRVFPSNGLTIYQVAEAIKAWNLSPLIIQGNLVVSQESAFDCARFSATCAAFIRSGYPLLIIGKLGGGELHAVCALGIRSSGNPPIAPNSTEIQDSWITNIYVHDDNIGPNVKLKINKGHNNEAVLQLDAPPASVARQALNLVPVTATDFVPQRLVVAVHNDLRTSADALHKAALKMGSWLGAAANVLLANGGGATQGIIVSARFIRLSEYLDGELHNLLNAAPAVLSKVRLALVEQVRPMSLHLGVVRIGDQSSAPLMDILYDTTDSDRNHPVFANVAFSNLARGAQQILAGAPASMNISNLGIGIDAF